jgi:predicted DNA-binding transcriptional regulator AlpA
LTLSSIRVAPVDIRLMGTSEIAKLLGVSRQRANQLAQREGFPEPIARLAAGPIWEAGAVEQWARDAGRID